MLRKKIYNIILAILITGAGFFGFFISNGPGDKTTPIDYINNGGLVEITPLTTETDVVPVWVYGTIMPVPTRYHGSGISYTRNDTSWLYCFGGDEDGSGNNSSVVSIYNVTTNRWSIGSPMSPTLVFYTSVSRIGTTAYIVGGIGPGGAFTSMINEVRRYSLLTNTWLTNAANYPTTVAEGKACGYQDSLIYVVGGIVNGTSTATANINLYNANTNTWRAATPLPVARCMGAMTITGDTIVYVCGGTGYSSGLSNSVYRGLISQSDRSVITWTTGANYPGPARFRFDAATWGCKGIIVGVGTVSGWGSTNTVYRYSPGANLWTAMPNCLRGTATPFLGTFVSEGNIWKFVMASGLYLGEPRSMGSLSGLETASDLYLPPPYSHHDVQIYIDTLCQPIVGINQTGEIIPSEYSLSQNHPNPFNPTTNIRFSLPKAGFVTLTVFDILGREAAILVNEFKNAGQYSTDFNASHLASGIYFYRIEAGDYKDTKKMLMIK